MKNNTISLIIVLNVLLAMAFWWAYMALYFVPFSVVDTIKYYSAQAMPWLIIAIEFILVRSLAKRREKIGRAFFWTICFCLPACIGIALITFYNWMM
jgi:hypothetical protein